MDAAKIVAFAGLCVGGLNVALDMKSGKLAMKSYNSGLEDY